MSSIAIDPIPFERQEDSTPRFKMCGAAALAMVYRSFGLEVTQAELWPSITGRDRNGDLQARTHLLCRDALRKGYLGIVFRARDPWRALERAAAPHTRAILNHRVAAESAAGHYSVLVGLEPDAAILHDPRLGPGRRVTREELLALWLPTAGSGEITGNVLLVLARSTLRGHACGRCGSPFPPATQCPTCHQQFPLHPAGVLGCVDPGCPERIWERLFCPFCDAGITKLAAPDFNSWIKNARERMAMDPNMPATISDAMNQIHQVVAKTMGELDTVSRERLAEALGRLSDANAQSTAQINELAEKLQARAAELQRKASELEAKTAAAADRAPAAKQAEDGKAASGLGGAGTPPKAPAAPPSTGGAPPKMEEAQLSPDAGKKLRQSLLARFGNAAAAAEPGDAPRRGGEPGADWKDWLDGN